MSEIRRVNTGDAPRNVYHAGDAPRTVNTGRTVKTGSALNQDEYEAARRRAQQLCCKKLPQKGRPALLHAHHLSQNIFHILAQTC